MYPIGHFSVALATRDNSRNIFRLLFCCFLTILPDFDFLVGIEHRGLTHSIVFAVAIGFLVSRKNWAYYSFLVLSHSILDMLCQDHPRNGVQLFWPLSRDFFQFPFHPFVAMPMYFSMVVEFLFCLNILLLRETYDEVVDFLKN